MSDGPPPAKKPRSCSSSESTPNLALDEATATTLLDAVRRYEAEATRRNNDAQAEVASAKDDVLASMETLKRAHERLGRVEAVATESAKAAKTAQAYRSKWELQLIGKRPAMTAAMAPEHDEEQKHVSFAVPQHHHIPRRRRRRVRHRLTGTNEK